MQDNRPRLHVISFQVPYPPSYGGVIDVYYKLKALQDIGIAVTLHTYQYRHNPAPELETVADKVYYYPRPTGIMPQLSCLPYIVNSRRSPELLERLCQDQAPILFEGLHTCYFLDAPQLKERIKLVRAHNVEHRYYARLGMAAFPKPSSAFFFIEAARLKRFEKILSHAQAILAITPEEERYFARTYPKVATVNVPCFFDNSGLKILGSYTETHEQELKTETGQKPESKTEKRQASELRTGSTPSKAAPYLLYHGNLSVDENIHAVLYLLRKVYPLLEKASRPPFIIAGRNPGSQLREEITHTPGAILISDPNQEEMDRLIAQAHIHLLFTFQDTGFKLKLIHALTKGPGFCLVNPPMVSDSRIGKLCTIVSSAQETAQTIGKQIHEKLDPEDYQERLKKLALLYDNRKNAMSIVRMAGIIV